MIYPPSEDSHLIEQEVKKYALNKRVLDIGSGSGILARAAINAGAKSALASDINQESIKLLKKKKIPSIQSDLFSKIKGKFDLIIFNPPYLPQEKREDRESQLITTGGKKGDEIIIKFLHQAPSYLNKNGIILILLSSLTQRKRILVLIKKQNLKKRKIAEKNLFMEKLEVWRIKKSKHLKPWSAKE